MVHVAVGFDLPAQCDPVHVGHDDVGQHQVRFAGKYKFVCLGTVRALLNVVKVFQFVSEVIPNLGIVVDYE